MEIEATTLESNLAPANTFEDKYAGTWNSALRNRPQEMLPGEANAAKGASYYKLP